MELRPEEITKIIRSQIKNYESKIEASETGVVIVAGDGIATVSGLTKCMANELVEFPNGEFGPGARSYSRIKRQATARQAPYQR